MTECHWLNLKDHLNAYLVGLGEKPASFFEISATAELLHSDETIYEEIHRFLHKIGVTDVRATAIRPDALVVYAGRDKLTLDALVAAHCSQDDRRLGAVLGFPYKAIDSYCHPTRPRFASHLFSDLWRAKEAGIRIPSWVGYISHVPAQSDFVTDNVCPQSQWQGESYRKAIARGYPELLPKYDMLASRMVPKSCQATKKGVRLSW